MPKFSFTGRFRAIALAICVSLAGPSALGMEGKQLEFTGSYKPILIPIQFSIDKDGLHTRFTHDINTPFGAFSGTIGAGSIEPLNTYFLVRHKGLEKTFCIGKRGKLRLKSSGDNLIELSTFNDFSNVIVVDLKPSTGSFELEFVPDDTTDDLARVRSGWTDIVLTKSGQIVFDTPLSASTVSQASLQHVVFGLIDPLDQIAVSVEYGPTPEVQSRFTMLCEGQTRIEALWLRECLLSQAKSKVVTTPLAGSFGKSMHVFEDGSICFVSIVYGPSTYSTTEHFITMDFLRSLEYDGGAWWNFYRKSLTVSYAHTANAEPVKYELGDYSDRDLEQCVALSQTKRTWSKLLTPGNRAPTVQ